MVAVVVASDQTTLTLPFRKLGIPPEGCSSVTFAERYGQDFADRALKACEMISARDANAVGLVTEVVAGDGDDVLRRAIAIAATWVRVGRIRRCIRDGSVTRLREINKVESVALGAALIGPKFIQAQVCRDFLRGFPSNHPELSNGSAAFHTADFLIDHYTPLLLFGSSAWELTRSQNEKLDFATAKKKTGVACEYFEYSIFSYPDLGIFLVFEAHE